MKKSFEDYLSYLALIATIIIVLMFAPIATAMDTDAVALSKNLYSTGKYLEGPYGIKAKFLSLKEAVNDMLTIKRHAGVLYRVDNFGNFYIYDLRFVEESWVQIGENFYIYQTVLDGLPAGESGNPECQNLDRYLLVETKLSEVLEYGIWEKIDDPKRMNEMYLEQIEFWTREINRGQK